MTEEPIYSGLFSGLAAKSELDQLLDELYDSQQARQGEAAPQTARITPRYRVANDFEDFVEWFAQLKEEDTGNIMPEPRWTPELAVVS